MTGIPQYVWAAVISGFTVGLAVYIANKTSPLIAGFLAAFPVAMSSMIFIDPSARTEIARSFALGMLAYAIFAMLFYSLISQNGWNHHQAVYFCVGGWMLVVAVMWMMIR